MSVCPGVSVSQLGKSFVCACLCACIRAFSLRACAVRRVCVRPRDRVCVCVCVFVCVCVRVCAFELGRVIVWAAHLCNLARLHA